MPIPSNVTLSCLSYEYEVSQPIENNLNFIFFASSNVIMFLGCKLKHSPVAFPLKPCILFLYNLVPIGATVFFFSISCLNLL